MEISKIKELVNEIAEIQRPIIESMILSLAKKNQLIEKFQQPTTSVLESIDEIDEFIELNKRALVKTVFEVFKKSQET